MAKVLRNVVLVSAAAAVAVGLWLLRAHIRCRMLAWRPALVGRTHAPSGSRLPPPHALGQSPARPPAAWPESDLACIRPGVCGLRNSAALCYANAALQGLFSLRVLVRYFVPEALGERDPPGIPAPADPSPVEVELRRLFRAVHLREARAAELERCHARPLAELVRGRDARSLPEISAAGFQAAFFRGGLAGLHDGQQDTHDFRRLLLAELNPRLAQLFALPLLSVSVCADRGPRRSCTEKTPRHCSAHRAVEDDTEATAVVPDGSEERAMLNLADMLNASAKRECVEARCDTCGADAQWRQLVLAGEPPAVLGVNVVRAWVRHVRDAAGRAVSYASGRSDVRVSAPIWMGIRRVEDPRTEGGPGVRSDIDCAAADGLSAGQYEALPADAADEYAGARYCLAALALHMGDAGGGHYVAATRSVHDGLWNEYDDARVSAISAEADGPHGRAHTLAAYLGSERVQRAIYGLYYERC